MKLLLIGATGSPYFEHCKMEVLNFLGPSKRVGVLPAANLFDEDTYFREIEERLVRMAAPLSRSTVHVRWNSNWREALEHIDALVIPGGNTYALLKRLQQSKLLDALRQKITDGLPYVGASAGANIAGPNILTTNDWNVVGLTRFESLALVPFNINPHYHESALPDAPLSETRDLRIQEFHQIWSNPVLALEEHAVINVSDETVSLLGKGKAKVFARDGSPRWLQTGESLEFEHSASSSKIGADKRIRA